MLSDDADLLWSGEFIHADRNVYFVGLFGRRHLSPRRFLPQDEGEEIAILESTA